MKGTYVKGTYKKAPTVLRISEWDPWDGIDVDIPPSFASQSGVSPRGSSVVFGRMPSEQLVGIIPSS